MPRRAPGNLVLAGLSLVVGLCGACSLLVSTSDLAGPPLAGPGVDAMADVSTVGDSSVAPEGAATQCPTGQAGPSMIQVDSYCIDSTEVTNAQYAKFVASKNGDVSGQPAACSWNTSYVPATSCASLATSDTAPVTCVDWCDAYAYCAWAGKRLCGRIGGGPSTIATAVLAEADQWYRACSRAGAHAFPYGDKYALGVCNDKGRGVAAPIAVGTSPGCAGGYPGLFDMSGNVVEWTDTCNANASATDTCLIRGGAWDDDPATTFLQCSSKSANPRQDVDATKGFRCCS